MKVRLNDIHNPCKTCSLNETSCNPNSIHCQSCEYNIAIQLLKIVLKFNDYCTLCKNRKNLGGGYWECKLDANDDGCCEVENDFAIDWQAALKEYGIEVTE